MESPSCESAGHSSCCCNQLRRSGRRRNGLKHADMDAKKTTEDPSDTVTTEPLATGTPQVPPRRRTMSLSVPREFHSAYAVFALKRRLFWA